MSKFSIIIPCRDEEENVEIIFNNISKNCNFSNYEIIYINDYSTDTTVKKLEQMSNESENVFFYNNQKKGLGGAIELGLKQSKGDYITIMMADGADSVDDLNSYFKIIEENKYDAVFGSRFIKGSQIVNYPFIKLIFNRIGNYLTKLFFFSDYNDFTKLI